jgi:hypothetical protein
MALTTILLICGGLLAFSLAGWFCLGLCDCAAKDASSYH